FSCGCDRLGRSRRPSHAASVGVPCAHERRDLSVPIVEEDMRDLGHRTDDVAMQAIRDDDPPAAEHRYSEINPPLGEPIPLFPKRTQPSPTDEAGSDRGGRGVTEHQPEPGVAPRCGLAASPVDALDSRRKGALRLWLLDSLVVAAAQPDHFLGAWEGGPGERSEGECGIGAEDALAVKVGAREVETVAVANEQCEAEMGREGAF